MQASLKFITDNKYAIEVTIKLLFMEFEGRLSIVI